MKHLVAALVVVAALAGAAVDCAAQSPTPTPPAMRTLEVVGHGEARATPDLALLNIAIETHGATAEEAASQNAELSQKVVAALKKKLGDGGKIWTGGYNLFPDYAEQKGESKPRIQGYRAENSISLETGALDQVGALIDSAISAGANRVNSLNFSLREDTAARSEAISKASKDAQTQAQSLAGALGLKLKRIVQASTQGQVQPMPMMNRGFAMAAMERAPTPVQPGEVTVPATVALLYEVE